MAVSDLLTKVHRYDRSTGGRLLDVSAAVALDWLQAHHPSHSRESLAQILAAGRNLATPNVIYTVRDLG